MDETEAKREDAELSHSNREYVWFAIALLFMMILILAQMQG
jgi:hypothetical protein